EEIGSAVADAVTGLWSLEPNQDLTDGENSLTLVTRDTFAKKDRESEESEPFTIVVGPDATTPGPGPGPGLVFIDGAEDNVGANTGPLASGALTDDTRPELHGTAPAGSTLRLQYRSDNGDWIEAGNVPVNADGSWSWIPTDALPDGSWEFRVRGDSGWTDEFALDIDSAAQDAMLITHATDNKGPYTGELASGVATDDDTPTLHGTAEANSVVYLHGEYGGNGNWSLLGSVVAGPDGRWSLTTTSLIITGSWRFHAGPAEELSSRTDTFL
ncbi:Ig-like domain-containing protein, partial [Duffyella gerundensis]|uniref:Ig-like domain-containing protein n=3 Tax=Duffyella TaxID=3026546 RepID=UPI003F6E37A9